MKTYLTLVTVAFSYVAFGQSLSDDLATAVKKSGVAGDTIRSALPSPHLNYYSKNYKKIFGNTQYTFDRMAFGPREVYVSSDDRFYYNGSQNIPNALPTDPVLNYYSHEGGAGTLLAAGMVGIGTFGLIKNIISGTKDYQLEVNPEAFMRAGRH